jgi:hypothetical protein
VKKDIIIEDIGKFRGEALFFSPKESQFLPRQA